MNNLKVWFLFGLFLCLAACMSDQAASTRDQLTGLWVIETANRNGKPITTLENVYFEFSEDGNLTSNLPLSRQAKEFSVLYEVKKDNIHYAVDENDYVLQIQQLTDSLIVNTNLQNTPFQMILVRQAGSESGE